ncbi:hypothetical protein E2C01_057822 [Portunus trituberculatus]|uniref:Uncharacterized protein n=1 Tax=Portunus trituberculatus TaxID=210409 RepID=A0A5B7GUJ9_PORTR|nr:hypothetical protein [Portunus trituberculatus]
MRPSEELPQQETAVGGPCVGESSFPLRIEADVSRASYTRARETTYWDYKGRERWLLWTGYLVPMRTSRFKKMPHMIRMFVHDRAETPFPKSSQPGHPTIQHRTAPIGRCLQRVAPLVHWQPT